jgi:hypothetical protein
MSSGLPRGASIVVILIALFAAWVFGVLYCVGFAGGFPQTFPGGGSVICEAITP